MRRGDIVTVAIAGDYGKPRPAVVIQSDSLDETDSVLLCLMTTTDHDAPLYRIPVAADQGSGLRTASFIMVEKVATARRTRCGAVIGCLDEATLGVLNRALALVVGLAG